MSVHMSLPSLLSFPSSKKVIQQVQNKVVRSMYLKGNTSVFRIKLSSFLHPNICILTMLPVRPVPNNNHGHVFS